MANHDPEAFEAAARAVGFQGFGFYPRSGFSNCLEVWAVSIFCRGQETGAAMGRAAAFAATRGARVRALLFGGQARVRA